MTMLAQSKTEADLFEETHNRASEKSLAAWFDHTSSIHAERTAVTCGSESMTYRELSVAADRVADSLLALSLAPGSIIAIYLDRTLEMVVAMLGVIKAGAAYLPIDPSYPEARVRETIADASPAAVLTDLKRTRLLRGIPTGIYILEELLVTPTYPTAVVEPSADDLAYVIYTSGSTGKPKGVMVTHRNVMRLLSETDRWFGFNETDVWTMFHSFAFDFSVWEMWGALLSGGRLVLVPYEISRSPEDFYALLAHEGVTVLNQTPTAFGLLMQAEARVKARPLALRYVIFGGEALNLRSLLPWFARHGDDAPQLINMYGITETTVHVTYRRIRMADASHEKESLIGEPIPDLAIHLLDEGMKPVADGEVGEICIGGPGVALGYLGRAELTAERFVACDLSERRTRLYRSGDLARRRSDGELVYLGRADRQVKINGFRIELGEIEAVLAECAGVSQACVIAHNDEAAGQRLAAYFVAPVDVEASVVGKFAEERLPAQMRPAFYTRLQALPMNGNGKVDRAALPAPERLAPTAKPQIDLSAATSLEQQIAIIWRHVLQVDNIGHNENFFDAGGSSLLLITLRNTLQTELNVPLPITWLFEHTTIHSLATRLMKESQIAAPEATLPSSRMQQQRDSFARMRSLRGGTR